MQTHLTRTVRDNAGHIHHRGEHVTILGHWLELGTHRLVAGPVGQRRCGHAAAPGRRGGLAR